MESPWESALQSGELVDRDSSHTLKPIPDQNLIENPRRYRAHGATFQFCGHRPHRCIALRAVHGLYTARASIAGEGIHRRAFTTHDGL